MVRLCSFIPVPDHQFQIRRLCFFKAKPDIRHVAEVYEPDGGFFGDAGFNSSVNQTLSQELFIRPDSLSNWADPDHMGILNGKNIFRESAPARKQIVDFPAFGLNKLCLCLQQLQLG